MEKPNNCQEKESVQQISLSEDEKQTLINGVKDEIRKEVSQEIRSAIKDDVKKWSKKWLGIILALSGILGFIGFQISLARIYAAAETIIVNSITMKFAEPNIQNTLQGVASQEARTIVQNEVQPEAEKAKRQIAVFENYLNQMEVKFDAEYKSLADQVSKLEKRDKLMQLADDAINEGNRQAYEELGQIANDLTQGKDIRSAAYAEWWQVKRFYIGITRVKGKNLSRWQPDGTKVDVKNEDVGTQELIQALLTHKEWTVRVLAASILKDRKEKGVSEALLQAAHNDQNLDVVKEAIDSFQSVTGYKSADVFGVEAAEVWWQANKAGIETQLKEQSRKTVNQ